MARGDRSLQAVCGEVRVSPQFENLPTSPWNPIPSVGAGLVVGFAPHGIGDSDD